MILFKVRMWTIWNCWKWLSLLDNSYEKTEGSLISRSDTRCCHHLARYWYYPNIPSARNDIQWDIRSRVFIVNSGHLSEVLHRHQIKVSWPVWHNPGSKSTEYIYQVVYTENWSLNQFQEEKNDCIFTDRDRGLAWRSQTSSKVVSIKGKVKTNHHVTVFWLRTLGWNEERPDKNCSKTAWTPRWISSKRRGFKSELQWHGEPSQGTSEYIFQP